MSSGDVHDVPWITGVTSEEGLYPVAGKKYTTIQNLCNYDFELLPKIMHFTEFIAIPEALKTLEDNWNLLLPYFLDYNYTLPKEKHVEVATVIKGHYFGMKKIDNTTTKSLIQMASDRFFIVDSEKAARLQASVNQQPVWYYYYSYRAAQSLSDVMSGTTTNYGMSTKCE